MKASHSYFMFMLLVPMIIFICSCFFCVACSFLIIVDDQGGRLCKSYCSTIQLYNDNQFVYRVNYLIIPLGLFKMIGRLQYDLCCLFESTQCIIQEHLCSELFTFCESRRRPCEKLFPFYRFTFPCCDNIRNHCDLRFYF